MRLRMRRREGVWGVESGRIKGKGFDDLKLNLRNTSLAFLFFLEKKTPPL